VPSRDPHADIRRPLSHRCGVGRLGGSAGEQALIVLSLDSREAQELLANYRRALFAAMLFGGLAAAILGFLTARNSLRPLRQMAETASDISASRLDRRLEVANASRGAEGAGPPPSTPCWSGCGFVHPSLVDFSSDLAHELRTPINNLMGQTQVALSRARSARGIPRRAGVDRNCWRNTSG